MRKRDILNAELEPDGVKLTSKDGRVAVARFADSERLRNATDAQRAAFSLGFGGLRWEEIDEDLSYDGIFEPGKFPLRGSASLKPLNMSEVARRLKIPQPLMAAYVSGAKKPSARRERLIREEIRRIGRELLESYRNFREGECRDGRKCRKGVARLTERLSRTGDC